MIIKRNYERLDMFIELTTEELNNAYLERKNELDCQEVKDYLFHKEIGEIIDMCELPYPNRAYMLAKDVEKAEEAFCNDRELLSKIYNKFMDFNVMETGTYDDCMEWACKEKLNEWGKIHSDFLNQFKGIATIAYEKYKEAWIKERNYSPEFLAKIQEAYEESVRKFGSPSCLEEYIDEHGYNGECYVCFDEFLDTEYQVQEYMKKLLTEFEYTEYCKEFPAGKEKFSDIHYTGEIINLADCDRIVAIMVIDGKMYLSDCDHQDCYEEYCNEHGITSGLNWDDVENFDEVHKQAVEITNELFQDEAKAVYGFDIFEGYDDQYYLISHFPSNMEKCYEMMLQYAKENGYKLGTFFDSTYKVKMIEMNDSLYEKQYEIRRADMENYQEYSIWKHANEDVWEVCDENFFKGEDTLILTDVKKIREFDYQGEHFRVFCKGNGKDFFSKEEFYEPLQDVCKVVYCRFSEEDIVRVPFKKEHEK